VHAPEVPPADHLPGSHGMHCFAACARKPVPTSMIAGNIIFLNFIFVFPPYILTIFCPAPHTGSIALQGRALSIIFIPAGQPVTSTAL
jgi:hypothetical protein